VQRVVYAFILIIILAFLGGFPNYLAVGQGGGGSQSVTITVTATPVYSPPPGGGGGGGGAPPTPLITSRGEFTKPAILYSGDKVTKLSFDEGTVGRTKDGVPLRQADTMEMSVIYIRQMETPPPPPEDACIVGLVYDIGPNGAIFSPSIRLTFTYNESLIPEGVAEEHLVPAWWDAASKQWIPLEVFIVAPEINMITGVVNHLTPFAILGYIPPPAFAAFAISTLLIIPTEVDIGETVNVIILLANTGGQSGSYEVTLKINGVIEATKSVTVDPGTSKPISFTTIKNTAGTYSVEVEALTGSFTVKEKPVAPPPPPAKPISWWLIGGIIAAVVAIAFAIFFLRRR